VTTAPPTDQELIALLRNRLTDLEMAVMDWQDVMQRTSKERAAAWDAVTAALTTDFRTAVLTSSDMTEEQRQQWLNGPPDVLAREEERHDTAG
jgi:hypothetical protein